MRSILPRCMRRVLTVAAPLNCYNLCVMQPIRAVFIATVLLLSTAFAQDATPPATQSADKNPTIKLNFLNVCTPNDADKKEIAAALNKIPAKVNYTGDFEVTRGRAIGEKAGTSKYVRLRRDLANDPNFNNILYSLSADATNTTETLVFKTKDPKDLVLISIEDQISAGVAKPASVLDVDTPANHIKLERFGKASIALARCENADQSSYEPLFAQATKLIADYRKALGLRTMFRTDLAWLSAPETATPSKAKSSKATKSVGAEPKPTAESKPTPETKPTSETKPVGKHLN